MLIRLLIIFFMLVNNVSCDTDDKLENSSSDNNLYTKIDNPLIEYSFNKQSNYILVNRVNLFTENEYLEVVENSDVLNSKTDIFAITTFPSGKGTTPNGIIYLYKDKELIKELAYFDILDEGNLFIEENIEIFSVEDFEAYINKQLPSPI